MPPPIQASFTFALDWASGVPVYRQIIDQVASGMAAKRLRAGDQLPTVRQLAVDLSVNPNTVVRAYRELEIRGLIETQQGIGTFISRQEVNTDKLQRQRQLAQFAAETAARAGREGYTVTELVAALKEFAADGSEKGR